MLKYKKLISVILSLTFVSMLYNSCFESNISEPQGEVKQPQEQLTASPGKLHNEILAELNKEGCLTNGARYDRNKFVSMITTSSNVIFSKHGIDIDVTEDDLRAVLECFDGWKEEGIFDVYTPVNERNVEDVYTLLDYLEAHDNYDPAEIRDIRMAVEEVETIGFSNCDQTVVEQIVSTHESRDRDSELNKVLNILESSYNFWDDLKTDVEKNSDSVDDKTSVILKSSTPEPILTRDWWSITVLLWDAVGALLCWYLGPVSIICAVAASAAYIIATTGE